MTYDLDAYSSEQREEMAAALEYCKQYLWDGHDHVGTQSLEICHALCRDTSEHDYGPVEARWLIMGRLQGYRSVTRWLEFKVGVPYHELTNRRLQEYRLAWINELIRELRA